jgi:anti-anti-sigma factor
MELSVTQAQGRVSVTILHITGRINMGNAAEIEQKARQIHQDGSRYLVIDLSQVESLTSAGLRAIHVIYKLFRDGELQETNAGAQAAGQVASAQSPQVKLAGPSADIHRVLKIAGFEAFLEIYSTVDEAVVSF